MSTPNIKAEQEAFVEQFIEEHEDELAELHAKSYMGTDDQMSDDFDRWLSELTYGDLLDYNLVK
jgi:hypothetical protein